MSGPPTGFYPGGLRAYRERQRARLAELQAESRSSASQRPLRIRRPEQLQEMPPLPGIRASLSDEDKSDDDEPGSPVSPVPPHVNDYSHQLYNIHRPLQGLFDIIQRQDTEREEKKKEKAAIQENKESGNPKSPWSRIKPLKPNALDDYDTDINAHRARQRREQSAILSGNQRSMKANKWVKLNER